MEFQLSLCINEEEHAGKEVLYKYWHYILPWKRRNAEEIIPHTITLHLQNFIVFLSHWRDKHSPFLRLTNLLPSDPNKMNLDSSLKWTIFHCFSVPTICYVAKSRWTFWFFFEIKGLRHGILATNFSLSKQRERVFLEIGFPIRSQNAKEIEIITFIWSSCLVVIGGLSVLGFGSIVLSALNLLITW